MILKMSLDPPLWDETKYVRVFYGPRTGHSQEYRDYCKQLSQAISSNLLQVTEYLQPPEKDALQSSFASRVIEVRFLGPSTPSDRKRILSPVAEHIVPASSYSYFEYKKTMTKLS